MNELGALLWVLSSLVALGGALSLLFYRAATGMSPLSSREQDMRRVLQQVALHLDKDGPIVELGCGVGRLTRALAQRFPDREIVAIEISPVPYLWARLRAWLSRLANIRFVRADFLGVPLGEAAAVVCYLSPAAMRALQPKLAGELLEGSVVVCNTFPMPGWAPDVVLQARQRPRQTPIYVYIRSAGHRSPELA